MLFQPEREEKDPAWRRWRDAGLAIGTGNLFYFILLPVLPPPLRHTIFQVDLGLAVDFGLCLALYLALRRWRGRGSV